MKDQFLLNPEITYLNHGSFGACPKPIFSDYQQWQRILEHEPVQFIVNDGPQYLKKSKECLAKFIHCNADDFFFTANPTFAVNTIMRSLKLEAGDEILATNHEYGALDKMWTFYSKQTGVKYVRQNISLPIVSKEQILQEFWKGLSQRTKVIFINHMSSSTALLFPVKEICERARDLGIITIIDGAHIPAHIPLNITDLNPDYYTGALHKWMLTPKGSSFLYVKREHQLKLDPLVVSWGYDNPLTTNQFLDYHEQQGTRDISAFLTVPAALKFLAENNWEQRSANCRKMVRENYVRFCDLVGSQPICPITEEFLGQMASIPIKTSNPTLLKKTLYEKYKIEIPVMVLNDSVYIRYSINAYNSQRDLDILYKALQDILQTSTLIIRAQPSPQSTI